MPTDNPERPSPQGAGLKRTAILWGPVVAWMAVIFWFSSQPNLPKAPATWLDFVIKKGAHALVYAILAGLIWRALANRQSHPAAATGNGPVRGGHVGAPLFSAVSVQSFSLTLLYAMSDEWHQTLVPGRHGRPFDVMVDLLGVVTALLLIYRFRWAGRNPLQHDLAKQPLLMDD